MNSDTLDPPCGLIFGVTWIEVVGLLGVVATLVGLYFTYEQASAAKVEAKNANASATQIKTVIESTQAQIRTNQMLVLIPQLRWVASELDLAIESGDAGLTRRHLDNWRYQAGHVNGLLLDNSNASRKTLRSLQESVSLSTEATSTLMKGARGVLESCEQARTSIGQACDVLSVFVGQSATQVTDQETP